MMYETLLRFGDLTSPGSQDLDALVVIPVTQISRSLKQWVLQHGDPQPVTL